MSRSPEGRVQDNLMKKLEQIDNSFWIKPVITGKKGTPDIIGDIAGHAIYIEVKKDEKEKPDAIQRYRIKKALGRGSISFFTYSWKHCRFLLTKMCEAKNVPCTFNGAV